MCIGNELVIVSIGDHVWLVLCIGGGCMCKELVVGLLCEWDCNRVYVVGCV